jgi:hypothetical protein
LQPDGSQQREQTHMGVIGDVVGKSFQNNQIKSIQNDNETTN